MGGGSFESIQVDIHDLVDEIVFDPRMDSNVFRAFSQYIESLGYKKSVLQSSMYSLPHSL